MLSTIGAFFMALFLAFFQEYLDSLKTDNEERYQQIAQGVKFWRSPKP